METNTKGRLIEAGLKLFGLHGMEATSTRSLAQEAGVNLAAIPYHFGGKQGLYHAVLEHIVSMKTQELGPCLERAHRACEAPGTGRAGLVLALRELIRELVVSMLESQESRLCARIMLQEQIAPTAGFNILHEKFLLRVHGTLRCLLGRLLRLPADSLELQLHTLSIMGQMFIFRVGMHSLLALVGGDRLPEEHVQAIVHVCTRQAEALIEGLAAGPSGGNA
ncbi:CerR family C-terminal domain-containing protein [Fundidesulfovibrio agrisoli]|uniref:CerR family C-terminal domain-containing protein n=1 Tax=Fundidesulfovibrio agrisoli TaxID=2922717 RepID=UPI001FADD55A|nr:CerR family C-terminal domain-containing protein [Fundidesulfovibrio agrisoli]